MLRRTMILLSLTITVGALLLVVGCGGSNSNPVTPVSTVSTEQQPSRARGNATVALVRGSTVVARCSDPDGIASIVVLWWFGGANWKYNYYFVRGAQTFDVPLTYFGQAEAAISITDMQGASDSLWKVTRDGQVIRVR